MSFWLPLMPVAWLCSCCAPTASVLPSADSATGPAPAECELLDGLLLSRMAALRTAATGDDAAAIEAASEALAKGTENFAAERMNRGIQQALTGRKLADI